MFNRILSITSILVCMAISGPAFAQKKGSEGSQKNDVKFLDDITVSVTPPPTPAPSDPKAVFSEAVFPTRKSIVTTGSNKIENAASLQFKYALIMDLEVEMIQNLDLFKAIDEWYGTRYRLGGSTKEGVDCSALMQSLYSTLYKIALPRTAKEQYDASRRISRAELKEGDLIFFNTVGGVSHVGMYLQNNKFVHASSGGVTISDLYEDYWMRKFIGAGRIESSIQATASTGKP